MRIISAIAVTILMIFGANRAQACPEYQELSNAEVLELVDAVKNAKQGDMAVVLSYETLVCANKPIVRTSARNLGKTSKISEIRAMALQAALFEKDVITVVFQPKENMTKIETEFFKSTPMKAYPLGTKTWEQGCITIKYDSVCPKAANISVSGITVDLVANYDVAQFRLQSDGVLSGTWYNGNSRNPVTLPAQIILD